MTRRRTNASRLLWIASRRALSSCLALSALAVLCLIGPLSAVSALAATGTTWTSRASANDSAAWYSVAYGNGLFVAVGASGAVMTSADGVTWTSRTAAAANNWRSVTFGLGLFVAVGQTGTGSRVMTSPDGVNWTIRVSAADNDWLSVTYGNGLFVAVAQSGSGNRVMTSEDGTNWTSRVSAADYSWFDVTYGNGLFVAVAASGASDRVMTSPDGVTWTLRTSASNDNWYAVTYASGVFVAVGGGGGSGLRVMTSANGTSWTGRTAAAANNWVGVSYGAGLFVATSNSGTGNRVMTSPDGVTWTSRVSAANNNWFGLAYGNGRFVAAASSGTSRAMTSGSDCGDGLAYTAGDWRQFATPCTASASPASVASVLGNAPTANLSAATYGSQWALYGRNATNSGNTLLTSSAALGSGAGYWIKSFSAPVNGVLTVAGAAAAPTTGVSGCQSLVGCVVVAVGSTTAGSRMLGNPFGYDVPWSKVRIRVGGSSGTVYTPSAADAAGYVSKQIWIWNGSSYDTWDDATTPGNLKYSQSFFMKVLTGGAGQTIELLIPVNSTI
ncbi:hypothetical protein WOC76_23700 [Methylocystis sp. IM3]|uniref:hypothetical protein n=1 Tax=unclassified Methylocystis TaxID=2625913 RepID=UPI0031195A00